MVNRKIEQDFKEIDPYNKQNTIEGIIYKDNARYGDLDILRVNGKDVVQYIHTTPKFYYPGGVTSHRKYSEGKFPKHDYIKIYDKIDGTNICLFSYKDANGKVFRSYKTRLVPFLKESTWGSWIDMWDKCMTLHPKIVQLVNILNINFSFEMYGSLNRIITDYKVPLEIVLLFGITTNGELIDPVIFNEYMPIPKLLGSSSNENPDKIYHLYRYIMENQYQKKPASVEGNMLYGFLNEQVVFAYKCKCDSVLENMKQTGKPTLTRRVIYNTGINALESIENLDDIYDETINLLLEEFPQELIDLYKVKIVTVIKEVTNDTIFKNTIIGWYKEQKYKEFIPKIVMPEVVKVFGKQHSTKIFNHLHDYTKFFGS